MGLKDIKASVELKALSKESMEELQRILFELGYKIDVDGVYGSQTQGVFAQFKLDNKLTYPSLIGKTTVDQLLKLYADNDLIEDEPKHSQQPKFIHPAVPKDIDWSDFSCHVSRWFTVGEVFQFDKLRFTKDEAIRKRILLLARELDKIRDDWGTGIGVTSWYRPPFVNRRVGGVSNSRHLSGDAVDIYPLNGQMIAFQSWVDKQWHGYLGWGAKRGFVHLDSRNGKGWKTGGAKGARWNY